MQNPKIDAKSHKFAKKPVLPQLTDFSEYKRKEMNDEQYQIYLKKKSSSKSSMIIN